MPLRYAASSTKLFVLGAFISILSVMQFVLTYLLSKVPAGLFVDYAVIYGMKTSFLKLAKWECILGFFCIIIGVHSKWKCSEEKEIETIVRKKLFLSSNGNPLGLKDGETLPIVKCLKNSNRFELTITATSCSIDTILKVSSQISSCLCGKKYAGYAVIESIADISFNKVTFILEDVTVHKEMIFNNVHELKQTTPVRIVVQKGTYIDLRTSGSMLVAGKTRSGKSTAIISIILQALLCGRDECGSEIVVIDPKKAELSRCKNTYTLDNDGEARSILNVMYSFEQSIQSRQMILNDLSEQKGDVVKWWDAGMHPSFIFIDEYVALRSIFPKRASKDDEKYCLAEFDGILKRIVTMGASAGCYVIISIAEASVEEGGLPSMLKNAMSTKILLKPTLVEGRLIWDSEKIKDFANRTYASGDAWFSSTDGIHDNVTFVHFPIMNFPVYRALSDLLEQYYL